MSTEIIAVTQPVGRARNEYVELLTDKTILVSGASGYLGAALLSSLHHVRCRVVALVHKRACAPVPAESEATITSRPVDLSQSSVWLDLLRESRPDVIINLAAHEHRRNSQHAPKLDLAINSTTVLELLEACRELEIKPRIVQASSANIAGCATSALVDEDAPDQPMTLYAINKLAAERYLRYYAESFAIPSVSLRFGNIYGPLAAPDEELESRVVLNSMMRRALAGGPLYVFSNQACVRDFLYIDDAVRAVCAAAVSKDLCPGGKYIVGSGEGYSIREIVNEIARQVEKLNWKPVEIVVDTQAELAPIEWREFIADYSRLRSATGWEPHTQLRQGIDSTLRAFIGGQSP